MGWTWRRRVRVGRRGSWLARHTWLNLSRSGVSASGRLGPLTVNTRGRRTLRGPFGLSWRSGR